MKTHWQNFDGHLGTRANFFYDVMLDTILEISSKLYTPFCTQRRPAILVSIYNVFMGRKYNGSMVNSEKWKQNCF